MTDIADSQPADDSAQLRAQIADLRNTLDAIRAGGVDAVIAGELGNEQVYTLSNADRPYRLIIEEMDEGAAAISMSGVVLVANPRLARMVGRYGESLAGSRMADLVVEADRAAFTELTTLLPGEHRRAEIALGTADGPLPTTMAASGLDLDGTPVVCLVVTDLTTQKQVETTLRESEQQLARILEALPVGIYIVKADGTSQFANAEALRLCGLETMPPTATDVIAALTIIDGRTDRPYPVDRMPLVRALAGETSHAIDVEIRDEPGFIVPLEVWGTPVRNADRSLDLAIVTMADITERKQAERVMTGQAAMLDLAHDAVIVWDPFGRITYWNRGAETTYGFPQKQALGAVVHDLLQTQWQLPLEEILRTTQRDGQWEGELEQRKADGSRVVVATRWAPHLDVDGTLLGTMEINRDVTERKDSELKLAQRAAELETANLDISRSNEDLEQFAYVASHDLSEPLRAIRLPISLLAERYKGQLGADADEYIGYAVDGCQRMQKMIDDLLRWSRVGRIEEKLRPVDCAAIVSDVLASLEPAIADTGGTVTVGPLPTVTAEAGQVTQMFQNLISNALKFVAPGVAPVVEVAAERNGPYWRFTVTDNGIGIEARHRERIFGMFKRLHPRDEYPGTGIGLALAKKAVERHGGAIGVEDPPSGTGARFWFTLPQSRPAAD